jgi:hypothetical protein
MNNDIPVDNSEDNSDEFDGAEISICGLNYHTQIQNTFFLCISMGYNG